MTFNEVKSIVDAIPNGRIFRAEFKTPQTKSISKFGKDNGYEVVKHTVMPCRKGIEYANTNYIKMVCDELGYVIGDRSNGSKDPNNKGFADSTLNNKLFDLFSTDCLADRIEGHPIASPKVEYIVTHNGVTKVVDTNELKDLGIMQPCFFKAEKNKAKYEQMIEMKAEWEKDKANYPTENKIPLARLIRDMYNKMFSVNVENIIAIG